MEKEMTSSLDSTVDSIQELIQPLQVEAENIVERVLVSQERLSKIADGLQKLQQRAANVE